MGAIAPTTSIQAFRVNSFGNFFFLIFHNGFLSFRLSEN